MYSFESTIRYSEVGKSVCLSLDALMNYFQDCSSFQSEELGIGMDYLMKNKIGWVLVSWQVSVKRYARENETVTISTWPYRFKGCFGYRNFTMTDSDNQVIACADSLWVFMDMETGHPGRVPRKVSEAYVMSPQLEMEPMNRKIKIPQNMERCPSLWVRKTDIDTNQHVNNANYIRLAMEYIPDDKIVRSMRVEYKNAAVYGDEIVPMIKTEDDRLFVVFEDTRGEVYVTVAFTLKDMEE